jgi:hypothetical protein
MLSKSSNDLYKYKSCFAFLAHVVFEKLNAGLTITRITRVHYWPSSRTGYACERVICSLAEDKVTSQTLMIGTLLILS